MATNDRPVITLMIVDIDNTLFDWFAFWYSSFSAMVDAVLARANIDREILLQEIRAVHQKHGTTEYSWILQELPSISVLPDERQREIINAGRIAYRDARQRTSYLYASVDVTLLEIKRKGAHIVGFTESQSFYTIQRLLGFGLDGVLDALYCREEHSRPPNVDLETVRSRPHESYVLRKTRLVELATHNRKPDPEILLRIARDFHAPLDNVLYVGDSKMKDIYMAQQARVHDAHAEYGQAMYKEGYDLLRAVSSWSSDEIAKEVVMEQAVTPTVVLRHGLAEIFEHFRFSAPPQQSHIRRRVR